MVTQANLACVLYNHDHNRPSNRFECLHNTVRATSRMQLVNYIYNPGLFASNLAFYFHVFQVVAVCPTTLINEYVCMYYMYVTNQFCGDCAWM